ncbi:MAG TPA: recombinase family protein [Solirubrobacteraceae bacterium]|jgi:DNA invertase Pin-like site-specific DNA recombinase|nr:recombinase family protein [Solirubrobacteraceae bacterium]
MRLDHVIRTSQRKQDALSPAQQRRIAADFERRTGHEIVFVHDSGKSESGKTMDRAALRLLRERVRAGQTDGAFLSYLDRLGRAPIEESMSFVRGLVELDGGKLLAADWSDEPIDLADPNTEDMLVFRLQMNRSMWNKAAARQRDNKRDSLAAGKFIGPTPFGYCKVKGRLVPDRHWAPVVREAFDRAAADSLDAARDYLLDVAPHERIWRSDMVRKLLGNRTYLGEHAKRGLVADVHPETGEVTPYKPHPPLVDVATFDAAQHAPRDRRANSDYVLSGLVRCECGANLVGQWNVEKARRYRCTHSHSTVLAAPLVEQVRRDCAEVLADADVRKRLQPEGLDEAEDTMRAAIAERDAFVLATSALSSDFGAHIAKLDAAAVAAEAEYHERRGRAKAIERLPAADRLDDDDELRRGLAILRSRGMTFELRRAPGPLAERVTLVDDLEDGPGALAA